jgi:hypothetical protein
MELLITLYIFNFQFTLVNILNSILGDEVQTGSTRHVGHLLAYCTCPV